MKIFSRKHSIVILCVFSLLMLSGCSLFSAVKTDTSTKYIINRVPSNIPRKRTHRITLLVQTPISNPIYDTTNMIYVKHIYQVSSFSVSEWIETPAVMLQPLLVQTLQNTHYFHAVVTPNYLGQADYSLVTQILQLEQDFTHDVPLLRLTIRVQLIRTLTSQIIATQQFSVYEPFYVKTPYGGVFAANQATADILAEIARFVIRKI